MKPNRDFITMPEIARIALVPLSSLKRMFSARGIQPDQVVTLGRGRTPLFARSRMPEILARIQSVITENQTR
jgi:hypothetical protein